MLNQICAICRIKEWPRRKASEFLPEAVGKCRINGFSLFKYLDHWGTIMRFLFLSFILIAIIPFADISCRSTNVDSKQIKKETEGYTVKDIDNEIIISLRLVAVSPNRIILTDGKDKYFKIYYDLEARKEIRKLKKNTFYTFTLKIKSIYSSGEVIYEYVEHK